MRIKGLTTIVLALLYCNLIAQTTGSVYQPQIPVVINRPYNIVAEVAVETSGQSYLQDIEIDIEGIEPSGIDSLCLVSTGGTSMIGSRSESFVLKDAIKRYGGGQELWTNPGFVMPLTTIPFDAGTLHFNKEIKLIQGRNFFYISLAVHEQSLKSISDGFKLTVNRITVDNQSIGITQKTSPVRNFGVSVRQRGDDGAYSYRIPGIVTANNGTLIAVYDIRRNSMQDLQNDIDVGVSRSLDGGRTWQPMQVVLDQGEWGGLPNAQNGVGDPSILVDTNTGEVFVFALWTHGIAGQRAWTGVGSGLTPEETGQILMTSSKDNGETWSEPRNITTQIKDSTWFLTLQGPGRGICMKDGTLVLPIQFIGVDRIPSAGIIFSKDHGRSWSFRTPAKSNTTEAQVAEISDGKLLLSMRDNRKTGRAFAVTDDLGTSWTEHSKSGYLNDPVCMAGLLAVQASENILNKDILLFSNPAVKKGRNHMTIKASLDGGYTWKQDNSILLDQEDCWGYSCLTMIDGETVGIIYESSVSQILFQAIKLKDIVRNTEIVELSEMKCNAPSSEYAQGVSAAAFGKVGGRLIVAGGANFPATGEPKHYYEDILVQKGNAFVPATKLPESSAYAACFVKGGKMMIAGGNNGRGTVKTVYEISPKGKSFECRQLDDLPYAVEQAACVVQEDGNILIIGGISDGTPVGTIIRYDGNKWETVTRLPENMIQPVAFYSGHRLFVWGGFDTVTKKASSKGYIYDFQTELWADGVSVPKKGTFTGATLIPISTDECVVFGGVDKPTFESGLNGMEGYLEMPPGSYHFSPLLLLFNAEKGTWTKIMEDGHLSLAGAAGYFDNGYLYIYGGEIKPGVRTNQILKVKL